MLHQKTYKALPVSASLIGFSVLRGMTLWASVKALGFQECVGGKHQLGSFMGLILVRAPRGTGEKEHETRTGTRAEFVDREVAVRCLVRGSGGFGAEAGSL